MLPNGTVMVIGGETGSNGSPEPNVEILPTPNGGDTVIFLDWLNRTDPNNLYPFVFVLPSGNLFVGASFPLVFELNSILCVSLLQRGSHLERKNFQHSHAIA
jgi:hypothetical protein